jgi:transposase
MTQAESYRSFFLHPESPRHRHYELLRARFVEGLAVKEIAARFAMSPLSVQTRIRDFKRERDGGRAPEFFAATRPGPKAEREKAAARDAILALRARGYADTEIQRALKAAGVKASVSLVDQVLSEKGLGRLAKRTREERERVRAEIASGRIPDLIGATPAASAEPASPAVPATPAVADTRTLDLSEGRALYSRMAGVFLFLPFLLEAGLAGVVERARMAGTKMIPAVSYVLSLLALKLLDKERKSHVSDWSFDEGLGLFAGLNVLPKTTATEDYTYRLVEGQHNTLLAEWTRAAYPILCPQGASQFAFDFHTIPHRGRDTGLENHYAPMRGKAVQSVLTCFAHAVDSPLLCYGQADIVRAEQSEMVLRFVRYWKELTGSNPDWLYFDSKGTTYPVLDQLRTEGINFITIRRRGAHMIEQLRARPARDWTPAVIDTPQRRHQHIRYLDEQVKLTGYDAPCRQIAAELGRPTPTLFLTDNETATGRDIVVRYIARNAIENDLGINVNFFHLNCLASEVRLNVHADVVLTVLANGCYRWLSQRLKGCASMEPKHLYRKFVETGGHLRVAGEEIVVSLDRRSHNPILAQAALDADPRPIPWLGGKHLRFEFK